MHKKLLLKLGVPLLALSLVAACGTTDDEPPVDNEAPLNQEDDNNNQNPMENNGDGDGDNNDNNRNSIDNNGEGVGEQMEEQMDDMMPEIDGDGNRNGDDPQSDNAVEEDENQ